MNHTTNFRNIAIVGLGLLGSSLATIFKRKYSKATIVGISSPNTVKKAIKLKIIHEGYDYNSVDRAVKNSDIIFLCTPITHIMEMLKRWNRHPPQFQNECIVTDVGSTKTKICRLGQKAISKSKKGYFIGSHPMAGSEKRGIEARNPHLFENASWVICPHPSIPKGCLDKFKFFIEDLGARTSIMAPEIHDKVVAHVSHLPQLISTAIAGFLADQHHVLENSLQIAGSGFRDMTRLANSSLTVWEPIFSSNNEEIQNALNNYICYLQNVNEAFKKGKIQPFFQSGKSLREKLSLHQREFTSDLTEILLSVPDKPGKILKVREGESGTIRIAFKNLQDAENAVKSLVDKKFEASIR
jgi:prephenate dehydrogenase